MTRELLAWPSPQDWLLRVSVAEIGSSGPFSSYPGVERWIAVLDGGAVRLETAGMPPKELTAADSALHAFSGDFATHCTALGPATRDFNLMSHRARVRLMPQALRGTPLLATHAEGVGLFVVDTVELTEEAGAAWRLPAMSLAWWSNPRRTLRSLRAAPVDTRGWWFEVETDPQPPPLPARRPAATR